MNIKKIEDLIILVGESMRTNAFSDGEYLIFVANLLMKFGLSGLESEKKYLDVNTNDAFNVELALNQSPNDPHLAAILQGHVLIKWSESFNIE